MLRDVRIEVVQQHPQRRFRRPRARIELSPARRTDASQITAQRFNGLFDVEGRHLFRCSARNRLRQLRQLQIVATTKKTLANTTALTSPPPVTSAITTTRTAMPPYTSTASRYGRLGVVLAIRASQRNRFTRVFRSRPRRLRSATRRESPRQPFRCRRTASGRLRAAARGCGRTNELPAHPRPARAVRGTRRPARRREARSRERVRRW